MKPISDEQKTKIIELYNSGLNGYQVAKIVGLSKSVVYKYLKARNHYVKWSEKLNQLLCDGRAEGKTYKQIAAEIGCTAIAARIAMHRHRVKIRADPSKKLVASVLLRAMKTGATATEALRQAKKADILRAVRQ